MICEEAGCTAHYGCRLKQKGLQLSPTVTPTKTLNMVPATKEPPAYNRTIMYDERPGGIKMPIINATTGDVVRQKEWDAKGSKYTEALRTTRGLSPATS